MQVYLDFASLQELSSLQKEIRLQLQQTKNPSSEFMTNLRFKRNLLLRRIRKKCREQVNEKIDFEVSNIEKVAPHARMFKAIKQVMHRPSAKLLLKDTDDHFIVDESETCSIISKHFQSHFSSVLPISIPSFSASPLNSPITVDEVDAALRRLNNGKACGSDDIPAELLKYGRTVLASPIANLINTSFVQGQQLSALGQGILIPLQKPGKPIGLCSSLRPIVLLNTIRKTLSNIVLNRIYDKVDEILMVYQSGFRQYRSTADAVWTHRWNIAKSLHFKRKCYILGIDLSKAFDTISREQLMEVLQTFLDEDEIRLIRCLLIDLNLQVKFGKSLGDWFSNDNGSPQGDGLSPILFIIYLDFVLRDLSSELSIPIEQLRMIIYADDIDFIVATEDEIQFILAKAPSVFSKWSLSINLEKTEITEIVRSNRASECWRTVKKLGSLLGDTEDVTRRIQLAAVAFHRFWKIWFRRKFISEKTRLRIYNAYVLPILLYNCGTWGLTTSCMSKLESFHRKHLRLILGIHWPNTISNKALYKRCDTEPLRFIIMDRRWRLFGHIMRRSEEIPANQFMLSYFNHSVHLKRWSGKPLTCLPTILDQDLNVFHLNLKSSEDLLLFRQFAQDRDQWRSFVQDIVDLHRQKYLEDEAIKKKRIRKNWCKRAMIRCFQAFKSLTRQH